MPSFVALVQPNRACRDSLRYCCSAPIIRFSPCFVALNEPTVPKSGPDLLRGGLDEADGHSRQHSRHATRRAAGVVRQPAGERHGAPLSRFLLKRRVCRCPPFVSFGSNCFFPPLLLRLHTLLDLPGAHVSLSIYSCRPPSYITLCPVSGVADLAAGGECLHSRFFRFGLLPRRLDDENREGLTVFSPPVARAVTIVG